MQLPLADSGQPRGARGAAGAPSARASRFSSQCLCRLQPAFLLMQQARAAKHWERRSETKAVYLSPLPPVVLRFGPPDQAESPIFALGIFSLVSFRNLVSSCARIVVSELPSRTASPVVLRHVMLGVQQPDKECSEGTGSLVSFSNPHSGCASLPM